MLNLTRGVVFQRGGRMPVRYTTTLKLEGPRETTLGALVFDQNLWVYVGFDERGAYYCRLVEDPACENEEWVRVREMETETEVPCTFTATMPYQAGKVMFYKNFKVKVFMDGLRSVYVELRGPGGFRSGVSIDLEPVSVAA